MYPFLWDLRFGEREGGGGIAGCIPYEGENWPGDGRGCPVLWEGGEEIGRVGIMRGRHTSCYIAGRRLNKLAGPVLCMFMEARVVFQSVSIASAFGYFFNACAPSMCGKHVRRHV